MIKSAGARLVAVASRRRENAESFAARFEGVAAVGGTDDLLARADIDAVYVATPTAAKEEIALAAIAAGKHVLVEKPFLSRTSVLRMTEAAAAGNVAFMDATHFVHHPRTGMIQAATAERIGSPRSLHTCFYFPFSDRSNIRFDLKLEPMSALGDMAWYSMRAVVEYLRPKGRVKTVSCIGERDLKSTAVLQASGLIGFDSGEVSTFDIGYTAGTTIMNLELVGTAGIIEMDDFVLDWRDSFAFKNPGIEVGYGHRTGMATRNDVRFVATPATVAQERLMVEDFATLAASGNAEERGRYAVSTLKTQEYVDALWQAANS
jgi:predicted dehydrogenase